MDKHQELVSTATTMNAKTASDAKPLTYEQEVHALLYAAASNTESFIQYLTVQAEQEKGDAQKLTQKCIDWKRDDLRRIRALIPQALARRDSVAESEPEAQPLPSRALLCPHDRLDEEGCCRDCGSDMRSGIDLTSALPAVPQATKCETCEKWMHEFNMYRSAWLREIGGTIHHKTHEIDGFVLRTREIYEQAKKWLAHEKEVSLRLRDPFWMVPAESGSQPAQPAPPPPDVPKVQFFAPKVESVGTSSECPTCASKVWQLRRCLADHKITDTPECILCTDPWHDAGAKEKS